MSRIGEKVKSSRLAQNMPVKQLAKKCGVSEAYLLDLEGGKKIANDSLIKKLSEVLNINLNESIYDAADEPDFQVEEPKGRPVQEKKEAAPQWESAFSSIIKDIPVYDMDMARILQYKHLPVIDKKVDGHNPEKIVFLKAGDNSLSGYRIKSGDLVMVQLTPEIIKSGLYLIEYEGKRVLRHLRKLDAGKVLIVYNDGSIRTETCDIREIKILGYCLRAEIDLTAI